MLTMEEAMKQSTISFVEGEIIEGEVIEIRSKEVLVNINFKSEGSVSLNEFDEDNQPAVGDKIEVILDGGVRRGTHVLKALAMGAKACMIGRGYLYALAAGGQPAVDRALTRLRQEIERDMVLMGCSSVKQLNRSKLHID